MSLKARLTLLYTSITGGILLIFSVVIYILVSITLVKQIDDSLTRTMYDVLQVSRVTPGGRLEVISLLSLDANVFVQAWSPEGKFIGSTVNVSRLNQPLDPLGLQSPVPVFRDIYIENTHLRVLSVPLEIGERPFGTIQVATSMNVVDGSLRDLLVTLSVVSILVMGVAAVIGRLSTQSVLSPLESVTEAALQITETKDLSRRIPHFGPDDEVEKLVQAFNQNLSRLERLIETQRQFLADVGHELRTPLTVIKGNVDLMRRMGEMDHESIESIEDEVERLTRLVGDLLLLAQAEAGKLPMASDIVEMDTILLEVFRQAQVLAGEQIELKIGSIDQVLVCGDRDRLKQVVLNLVSNGIKYTPPGGRVVVSLGKVKDQGRLTVSDTGPGIPKEDLPHIFDRFYRGEKSRMRSRDGKGFGLGLSIAYWIVQNHHGQIEVDSQPGKGTTFCVWLPLAEQPCQPEMWATGSAHD